MKTRTLIALVAGAALLSSTALAGGFRYGGGVYGGFHGGYHGGVYGGAVYGGGVAFNSFNNCAPPVYTRGYAVPAYTPRTVIYNSPGVHYRSFPTYRAVPRYRSSVYYGHPGRSYYRTPVRYCR